MKPRKKFLKFYESLSNEARSNLVYKPYGKHPMSIAVIRLEIDNCTKLGMKILKELGFKEE